MRLKQICAAPVNPNRCPLNNKTLKNEIETLLTIFA